MRFDLATDGKYCQTLARKLVQLKCYGCALDMLDETSDSQTFELLLQSLPKREEMRDEFMDVFRKMKGLGYKRSALLFERAMEYCQDDLFNLFMEMKDECETTVAPELYKRVFRKSPSLEGCLLVVREAKHKSINLNWILESTCLMVGTLITQHKRDIDNAVSLLIEVGKVEDIPTAYNVIFQNLWSTRRSAAVVLRSVLKEWKLLGINSIYVFEAEILLSSSPEVAFGLFVKMKNECSGAASSLCYAKLLNMCQSFDAAREIVREAQLKSVQDLCFHKAVGNLLATLVVHVSDVPNAASVIREAGDTNIDKVTAQVILGTTNQLLIASTLFNAMVKENPRVLFPQASQAFFKDTYPESEIQKYAPAMTCVLNSFFLAQNPSLQTSQVVVKFLIKAGKEALAFQLCQANNSLTFYPFEL